MESKYYLIAGHQADLVSGWFKDRGGVMKWESQLIGEDVPDTLTPKFTDGELTGAPGWRFKGATPEELTKDEITVCRLQLYKAGGTKKTHDRHIAGAESVLGSVGCYIAYGEVHDGKFYNTVYYAMIGIGTLAEYDRAKAEEPAAPATA